MKSRYKTLDGIKGIAIIAVVLFHMGYLKYGYLGVDVFFVIAGFLTTRSVLKKTESHEFSYKAFLFDRFKRIMPLVFLVGFVLMLVGFIGMLPDDYENLCESIVASNIASNNILAVLTTGNYWDVVNDYKPLMHLWYVGVLVEFYIVWPLILMLLQWVGNKVENKPKDTQEYDKIALSSILGGVLQ